MFTILEKQSTRKGRVCLQFCLGNFRSRLGAVPVTEDKSLSLTHCLMLVYLTKKTRTVQKRSSLDDGSLLCRVVRPSLTVSKFRILQSRIKSPTSRYIICYRICILCNKHQLQITRSF